MSVRTTRARTVEPAQMFREVIAVNANQGILATTAKQVRTLHSSFGKFLCVFKPF